MQKDRGFQSIRRPDRNEDNLLEALAARKGVSRLHPTAEPPATPADSPETPAQAAPKIAPAPAGDDMPTPRSRMKAMNLELPDYVMRQLKEQALREDCSVRHLIMRSLAGQGVTIRPPDLVPDGRRNRVKGS